MFLKKSLLLTKPAFIWNSFTTKFVIYSWDFKYIYIYIYIFTHTHTHMHACIHTHTHRHTDTHTHTHTHKHTCMQAYTHTYTHTHTHMHFVRHFIFLVSLKPRCNLWVSVTQNAQFYWIDYFTEYILLNRFRTQPQNYLQLLLIHWPHKCEYRTKCCI